PSWHRGNRPAREPASGPIVRAAPGAGRPTRCARRHEPARRGGRRPHPHRACGSAPLGSGPARTGGLLRGLRCARARDPQPGHAGGPEVPSPPAAVHDAVRPPGARATPTGRVALPPGAVDVLADLERNSTSPTVGNLLAALIDLAASAAKLGRFEQVLGVISGITRVEEKVAEASGVRRQYTIALRRIYTKPVLEGLSRLLAAPKHRAAALAALARGGAAG